MITGWRRPFPLFVLGALLYAATVVLCLTQAGADSVLSVLELLVPLFGLPYLLLGGRFGWTSALYLLLLVPAFHVLAVAAAIRSTNWSGSGLQPGLVGGLAGALLSFAALFALRLARPRSLLLMAVGTGVLTLLGGFGIWKMDILAGTPLDDYGLLLVLYLPWQIAFGFFLSRVMRAPVEIGLAAEPAPA